MSFQQHLDSLNAKTDLSSADATAAFEQIVSGELADADIVAFLTALRDKGETVEEITAAASVLRSNMKRIEAPEDAMDVCGTGGDGKGTYNISTTVALVIASCGVPVAKHGNRSVSSKSGSSDVLSALGVNIHVSPDVISRCLDEANICFLMAPDFHPAMKNVANARKEMGTRTIFNLLGPLCNPAGVTHQMVGVYDESLTATIAQTLLSLGSEAALVVSGEDGMDELSVTGKSYVSELADGAIRNYPVVPEMFTVKTWNESDIIGGDAAANAKALIQVLEGERNAYRDAVIMNSAAALIAADIADDPESAAALVQEAIDSGRSKATLESLIKVSNA